MLYCEVWSVESRQYTIYCWAWTDWTDIICCKQHRLRHTPQRLNPLSLQVLENILFLKRPAADHVPAA